MKRFLKIFTSLLCAAVLILPLAAGCNGGGPETPEEPDKEFVDYADGLKLDMQSETKKQEVTVKFYIDGDTTHFDPTSNASDFVNGYIKARYLAVNTPESTGDVEKWGKSASNFTHDKLSGAEKIIVESNDDKWNVDSTNERYLLWVWYIPDGKEVADENYRNLNVELLQEGYGRASKTSSNRYGETALAALMQAQDLKLKLYGNEKDDNWFGGYAQPVTLQYLRYHIADFVQHPVSVSGYVTARFESSVYIEEYDASRGISCGIAVYYGYKTGAIVELLSVGNYVNVVGTVGEFNGTYQISGVSYNEARPTLASNTQLIEKSEGEKSIPTNPWAEVSVADLAVGSTRKVTVEFTSEDEEGEEVDDQLTLDYGAAIMDTSVTLTNLTISEDIWTTQKGESAGAMSITVKQEGSNATIELRTLVLKKPDGTLFSEADFKDANGNYKKIASVKGIVDYYEGAYQLAIWDISCITFAE